MKLSLLVVLSALALASAAPAGALSGFGVANLLRIGTATVDTTKSSTKNRTCQAASRRGSHSKDTAITGTPHNTAVVACEQPPRSGVTGPSLSQTAANVAAALG
ncbi:MAG TPA: hypothetical protein VLV28_06365 [Gaiellaceae bacterium]|nr:hypothetical protein [Gaiellaceae bacterium]